jgi:phosphoribosyl-ATP pyrophosphohydrolase/phosphoribosyl-AMP cyclohydrolase/histidinol dehydrogenase
VSGNTPEVPADLFRIVTLEAITRRERAGLDRATLTAASAIVDDVLAHGEPALRAHSQRLGDISPGANLWITREALHAALASIPPAERALLERVTSRVRSFALAQRASIQDCTIPIAGGQAGHTLLPVDRAGCYAPGGRFPLPSSVIMTVATARAAGVREVWVASPKPTPITLAAAAVAGADGLLAAGGAQAVAAMARGIAPLPACDIIVGPGNRWVTAAKHLVSDRVGIDMTAGPSELVVLADDTANPATIAADLLAQAEHDIDAVPLLVTTSEPLVAAVQREVASQLSVLSTASTARAALANGGAVRCASLDAAIAACDAIAPEHLQVMTRDASAVAARLRHAGGVFIGERAAEVLGDYGAGPNHVLPTGGSARFRAGLSVFTFLRARTWIRIDDSSEAGGLAEDAAALARLEGLIGHERAALRRTARPG